MATGMARGAAKRGKRIAFGDGSKIMWDVHSELIFRHNPNIVPPNLASADNVEWVPFYRGNRIYNSQGNERWLWNLDFRAIPGEVFLTREEKNFAGLFDKNLIVVEPNLPTFKRSSVNKRWAPDRYEVLTDKLIKAGYRVAQFSHGHAGYLPRASLTIPTSNFRLAMSVLARAAMYIGPEGGLHHAAAAVGIPAVVIFGGFIPPSVTGYDMHTNLTGGATEACGSFLFCEHCAAALNAITVDEVFSAAMTRLKDAG